MSCFNCCVELTECEDSTKYKRPNQLSNNLQNRKWSPESGKPNISIMQALEDICDGEVSLAKLKIHSSRVVCHGDVFTDKPGQCWSCFCQFKEGDNKKKRMNMSTELVDGLNVMEGIESLLGEKADSLFGLYSVEKKQIGTVQSEDDNMPANKRQKMDSNLMERDPDNDWVLYRDPGDFKSVIIQMIFAEAGVAYQEMALEAYSAVIGTPEEFPNPSCSVLRRGTLKLSATPVICKYLAQQFDLYPANVHAQLQAEQICSNCHDFITEGIDSE
ncbi:hypothetical protein MAR_004355 [Mya arenaria]|uniref:GST N-terminal domain-containing protein n=1 Tax=Mya arenaria TaxID=6604 RepID=A0ABY7EWL8_MYAAR|nr:hypothetical protein MAR_004355 [Mya arenaria]